jgi:hypothetical protein
LSNGGTWTKADLDLFMFKYQGIKIRRELKSCWNKIKLKTFEQQGLDIDKKLM